MLSNFSIICGFLEHVDVNIASHLHKMFQYWFLLGNCFIGVCCIAIKATFLIEDHHRSYRIVVTVHAAVIFMNLLYSDAMIKKSKGAKTAGCAIAFLLTLTVLLYLIFTPGSWAEGLCIKAEDFTGNGTHEGSVCTSSLLQSCLVNMLIFSAKLTFGSIGTGNCIILTKPVRFQRAAIEEVTREEK
jgi:hypothetical protein